MKGFWEYVEYIYLNSGLSREGARLLAVDCWNKGMSKEEALAEARKAV